MAAELEGLEAALARSKDDLPTMQQILNHVRNNRIRRPDLVYKCAVPLLSRVGRLQAIPEAGVDTSAGMLLHEADQQAQQH
eukprot:607779-Rhodomonas_salina.2